MQITSPEKEGLLLGEEAHATLEYVLAHGIASKIGGKRILGGSTHFIHEDNGICVERAERWWGTASTIHPPFHMPTWAFP